MSSATAVNWYEDADGTELCHDDDGFVYRRKRRRRSEDEPSASTASAQPDPERDRALWIRNKLLNLRDRYRKEISHWEFLSNTLRVMEEQTAEVGVENVEASDTCLAETTESDSDASRVIDELLLKVERQEAMFSRVSNLCDVAESICSDLEEQRNKFLIGLSVWSSSPRKLMSYLCN